MFQGTILNRTRIPEKRVQAVPDKPRLDLTTADARYVRQDQTIAWDAATGTASRATFATYTAPTISNPPTQAEVQDVAAAVQVLSERMKALVDDLKGVNVLT